jgi:hypothetical protein
MQLAQKQKHMRVAELKKVKNIHKNALRKQKKTVSADKALLQFESEAHPKEF